MKKISVLVALVILMSACQTKLKKENEALKKEIAELKQQNEELKAGSEGLSGTIESYQKTLEEIDRNLSEIQTNQTMVATLNRELKDDKDVARTINQRISMIRALMENSKIKILELDKRLTELRKVSGDKSDEILALDKKVKELSQKLIDKQNELTTMRGSLEAELKALGEELEEQVLVAEELSRTLNRAYYIVADNKTLREKGIITKEGGFIGLGKVKVLNANAQEGLFIKAEKDKLEVIELNCKKAKLISRHPDGSFGFEGEGKVDRIVISDPGSFWKESNYLVIEVQNQVK